MIPLFVAQHFSPLMRERGAGYRSAQRVRIARATADVVEAIVVGTTRYGIRLEATPGAFHLSCTCPYASANGACKHIWAVLLQCERDRSLAALLSTAGAQVRAVFATDDSDVPIEGRGERARDDVHEQFGLPITSPTVRTTRPNLRPGGRANAPTTAPIPHWLRVLDNAKRMMEQLQPQPVVDPASIWPDHRRLVYLLDLDATALAPGAVIIVGTESRKRDGTWGVPKNFTQGADAWFASPDPADRRVAELLSGSTDLGEYGRQRTATFIVEPRAFDLTLRTILDTGRCRVRSSNPELMNRSLRYDAGAPWTFRMRVRRGEGDAEHVLDAVVVRHDEEMSLNEPVMLHSAGFLIASDTLSRFDHAGTFPLLLQLRQAGSTMQVGGDISHLLARVYALPHIPALELPAELSVDESTAAPVPALTISAHTTGFSARNVVCIDCAFVYGQMQVASTARQRSIFDATARVLHHRHAEFERACLARLAALGATEDYDYSLHARRPVISRSKLMPLVLTLARNGWQVRSEGVLYRAHGEIRASVTSGIDWFDLGGSVRYGDVDVPIADILDARRRGVDFVAIHDGSLGLLPEDWLAQLGPLVAAGENTNGIMRYRRSQVSMLDALLATLTDANVDATFERARAELSAFAAVAPADAPATFHGMLRQYQREGLGWLHFLRRFGLGGCLADDMGLGKTVQVLALLESRRVERAGPSLIVVPRSLVFNWLREAARFAPALRVIDFSSGARSIEVLDAEQCDAVIVTYGSLRRDAPLLASIEFDYVVLDEAQAIKNASTVTAKACWLLRARHRLAMSGTPIENRLEELWSLLEFLNPGMLGTSTKFATLARLAATEIRSTSSPIERDNASPLAQALRPLILRRTKNHVATELPARIEQTLEIELEPKQRAFYESVRKHVHATIMDRVAREGIAKSQLHILEALLRLRQAACHPVLVDATKIALPSAKLDALIPSLESLVAEGHKALVFSQFTEFLALVRERLDAAGVRYQYLDGKTRDRQARVDRFQADASCPLFLISLKAGGHGLNLTAADYVYLLDPWWNPAVEAQAIDRAHRIGQVRRVIATRLIARDTIETKILALQATKRALADAVLAADKGGLAAIGRSELELLLA